MKQYKEILMWITIGIALIVGGVLVVGLMDKCRNDFQGAMTLVLGIVMVFFGGVIVVFGTKPD